MSETDKFACALNCIDGRSIAAVDAWMKITYDVDHVDQPTKEGIVKTLAESAPADEIEKLKYRAGISVTKHGASVIAVVAHEHCAGNPVPMEEQLDQVKTAVEQVASWNLGVPVVGLFVSPQGSEWKVREI